MVNTTAFKQRLEQILTYYELSASAFADAIGVQRSSISHLLSGRNKPSLDFVLKVVRAYPDVNLYWLLNGKGVFPEAKTNIPENQTPSPEPRAEIDPKQPDSDIESIVVFYTDGSFRKFLPSAHKK
ncbi:helix-turn-helix transcriptional regulator [Robiginitalea aurantiaca]|uniref:Helix-turn-helix transcriptional regulator n=1 Tax=Robiginitalea aurantiaca TaxID=3056915 RepID=A0ABT7WFW9_9FLAO|nr:helix-turn-helix transcriptional regulator [Robiginitalea aurantiaca]MDM9631816.1 helix-turn-helix transcriptional regulator [Robiginitalea aurantiaca]